MKELEKLREEIDNIDKAIVALLGKRFVIVKKIGIIKKTLQVDIHDMKREKEKMTLLTSISKEYDLSIASIKHIWKAILRESKKIQKK
jgi:chorismate mutase